MTTKERSFALSQFGLSDRQQVIYLALLELGVGSAAAIAQHAAVERTGVYGVLASLERLGLVTKQRLGAKQQWVAQNPNRLESILRQRQQTVKQVLPELQALWQATDVRPRFQYFEGVDGMRTVIEDTLGTPNRQLCGILSAEDLFETVGMRWMENYTKRRIQTGLQLRVIRSKQKEVGERWPTSPRQRRELRYTPAGMVFSMTMYVYGNKVALLSTRQENFGMIIESNEFATHQRQLFEALWQISKPVQGSVAE